MLTDRETSYQLLVLMSQGLEKSPLVKEQMSQLEKQWKRVKDLLSENEKILEKMLTLSRDYIEKLEPFLVWLDQKERQLSQSRLQTPYIDKATEHIQELAVCFIFCHVIIFHFSSDINILIDSDVLNLN